MEFSVLIDALLNWEILWAMNPLLLCNTLESQYFTWEFVSVFTATHSHYGNVVLTSLQNQAKGIVTENLYTTLQVAHIPLKEPSFYLASWLFSILSSLRWQLIIINNHNFYHYIPYKRNLWWTTHALSLNSTFHSQSF